MRYMQKRPSKVAGFLECSPQISQCITYTHICRIHLQSSSFSILYLAPQKQKVIFFPSNLVIKTKTTNSSPFSCSSGLCLGCLGPSSCHMYTRESLEGSLGLGLGLCSSCQLSPFHQTTPFHVAQAWPCTRSGRLHLVVAECSSITLPSSSECVGSLNSVDLPRAL